MDRTQLIKSFMWAVALFLLFGFVWPGISKVQDMRATLDSQQNLLRARAQGAAAIADLDQEYKNKSQQVQRIGFFLPPERREEFVVESVQAAAAQSGLQLKSINTQAKNETLGQAYAVLEFDVRVTGSYPSLVRFLEAMEDSLRVYDVMRVDIKSAEVGGALDTSLTIRTYYIN